MTQKKIQAFLPLILSLFLVVGIVIGFALKDKVGNHVQLFSSNQNKALQEVLQLIDKKYVDEVQLDSITETTINDLLAALDPHSTYIPPKYLQDVNEEMTGNFEGVGIEFQMIDDSVHVMNILPGGPSDKAGIAIGDVLLAMNDTAQLSGAQRKPEDIRKLLRGPGGSEVKIKIWRSNATQDFTVKRGKIPLPSLDAAYMVAPKIGFIKLNKFSETTYFEFMEALRKLKKANMKKLILDLRGNSGGYLIEAVKIVDEFLSDDKLIVYTQGNHAPRYEYTCKKEGEFETGDLVVLIDENSASASEVVAGALQDWDRATIVGRRSFGKGLVQEQFNLSNQGALRLTVARYFTPLGRNIQKEYKGKGKSYRSEIENRYEQGELFRVDSSVLSGKSYKTQKGKLVYGGGGIMPDVFVGLDSNQYSNSLTAIAQKGILNKAVYFEYRKNKSFYTAFKNVKDFALQYKITPSLKAQIYQLAAKDSVDLSKLKALDWTILHNQSMILMAKQIWRNQGQVEAANLNDNIVLQSILLLSKK